MKKVTLVFQLFLITTILNGQEYERLFGSETTQWNLTIGNLWGTSSTEHFIFGDTIIDDKSYKKINGFEGFEEIIGFVRQDSLNEKAWYRNNQTTDEILIMDLSLNVGDSLFIQGVWNSSHKYYLVDSVYINDGRKHIQFDFLINIPHISFSKKFTLIEGVVSNMGFRYQDNDFTNGIPTVLLCAFKNEEKIFGEGQCTFTSVENTLGNQNIVLYPNPFLNELKIKFGEKEINGRISIIDLQGRIVYELSGKFIGDEVIDLSKLIEGYYFLCLYDNETNEQIHKKILKVTNDR